MRANQADQPEATPTVSGTAAGTGLRRGIGRWLPRPRAVAAGGALIAQLWGFGGAVASAANAEPPRDRNHPAVRRAPQGGVEAPGEDAVGTVGGVLNERIRSGGLPLPGQQAALPDALPDAFALASGLLPTVPAQARPAETRASRNGEPAAPPTVTRQRGTAERPREARQPAEVRTEATPTAGASGTATAAPGAVAGQAVVGDVASGGGSPEAIALTDTATVTEIGDGSATAIAVLAPIGAGLLLTGAAMCKHRGLPRGH
ncbi:hypothetical protein [Streptomyces sp. NRRL WC-3742]|uniref:hypothetical protein n=1 Tax=Streptomyces sp. NRRL WC-3742 TaxID=1463934 RepID=UPI0004CC5E67|nr:hypothetical protein [Streptomyces sp. NRRL WC-3742]